MDTRAEPKDAAAGFGRRGYAQYVTAVIDATPSTRLVGDSAPLSLHVNLPRTTTVERCVGLQCNDFRHGDVIPAATPGCTKV